MILNFLLGVIAYLEYLTTIMNSGYIEQLIQAILNLISVLVPTFGI